MTDKAALPYRPAVGVMLLNRQGKALVGQRLDSTLEAWQLPQGGLDEGETPEQGAFRVATGRKADVTGRKLLLIDDVLTSGATVDACARALLRGGAASVDVLVFARVVTAGRSPI